MSSPNAHASLTIGRRIRADAADVFNAWLEPRSVAVWMKPRHEVALTEVQLDARPGGTFRIAMRANGRDEVHEGVYALIDRPNRLRFSWSSVSAGANTTVDITLLTSPDGQTMLLLKHEGFTSHAARENHREGWRRILDNLAAMFEEQQSANH
jgi:uncharacterized protein YndB with AHSA1/START domain